MHIGTAEWLDRVAVKFNGDRRPFTYLAPSSWNLQPGDRVSVPVGTGDAVVQRVNEHGAFGSWPGPFRVLTGVVRRASDEEVVIRVPKGTYVRIVEE